jgi:hypothetical protein
MPSAMPLPAPVHGDYTGRAAHSWATLHGRGPRQAGRGLWPWVDCRAITVHPCFLFLKLFSDLNFYEFHLNFQNSHKVIKIQKMQNKILWNP